LTAIDTESNPIVLKGHEAQVSAVAFSPDSQLLVTGDSAAWSGLEARPSLIQLWNLRNSPETPVVLKRCGARIVDAAFSPDGHWLITLTWAGTVHIWTLWPEELMGLACRTAGRNLTQKEWKQYFPNEEYHITCPGLPVPEQEEIPKSPFVSPLPTPTRFPSVISPLSTPSE
jgi:WD40 repeat protein